VATHEGATRAAPVDQLRVEIVFEAAATAVPLTSIAILAGSRPQYNASMNTPDRVQHAADLIVRAHLTGAQLETGSAEAPQCLDEAYAVQDAVSQRLWISRGDAIRAWKTGGPNAQATPIAAPIPQSRLFTSPARLPGSDFHIIGIEAELAYRLHNDLPPRAMPYVEDDVAAAVGSVHVAIEVCDSRLRDWRTVDALWKLADMQMNGALIVGVGVADWVRIVPERQVAIVEVDAKPVGKSTDSHPHGNPLRLLPWLANHCAQRYGGLRAGDVITTGAWTGMHFVEPGASVVARFSDIGEARVVFAH